jgi:hypothetical protein
MRQTNFLFADGELSDHLSRRRAAMLTAIDTHDRNGLLKTATPTLAAHFVSAHEAVAPELHEDGLRVDENETKVDVSQFPDRMVRDRSRPLYRPGIVVRLFLPFSGEADLLRFTPSTRYAGHFPAAWIEPPHIVFSYSTDIPDEASLRRWKNESLSETREYVSWVKADVTNFNRDLVATARDAIERRKERLLKSHGLVASLGVPLRERPDAPRTYIASSVQRRLMPLPAVDSAAFSPEPALGGDQFDHILTLLRPMGATMERDPGTFASLDEEALRSIFLATLNSHYQGRATGETFNASGKTDILIRENDRNIFIAECKVWRGAKAFAGAIDQLLGYATWRDGKLALLVFVKQKGFSEVLNQIPDLVKGHSAYLRGFAKRSDSEWSCTVASLTDPARELTLAALLFHIRVESNAPVV